MDALEAVDAASTQIQEAQLVDRDRNVISEMTGDQFGRRVGEEPEIVRGALCEILRSRVGDVEVVFGDVIERLTQSADGLEGNFRLLGRL
jgi:hypothetical protein